MHKSRVQNLVLTVLATGITVLFVVLALPEAGKARFSLLFAPFFAFVAGIGAASVLLPNIWYRHRERVMKRHAKANLLTSL
jgi:uncharacterized membrane protein YccC